MKRLCCDNCGKRFDESCLSHVYPDIPDLLQRIEPGGVVPHGECSECGAFVYEDDSVTGRPAVIRLVVRGGVTEVIGCSPDCIVEIHDHDTDGCEPERLAADGSERIIIRGPVICQKTEKQTMKVEIHKTVYVTGASCALLDKVRGEVNSWADGDENVCMTFEDALGVEELKPLLKDIRDGGDVILSR